MSSTNRTLFRLFFSESQRYTFLGALFGLAFPIAGTFLQIFVSRIPLTLQSILQVQSENPILWIVDTAPIVLGIFAGLAGRRQDILQRLNDQLKLREKELEAVQDNLGELVTERTRELQRASEQAEKRATRLQAITELSETIALMRNPDQLLPLIVRSISERFGHYHTGIFLLDDAREFAVLRAANSPGGQKMLARGHQLKAGGAGIVGYVAQSGQPRLALDTEADVVFFNNPDLPETRSEVALPLKVGNRVIGVLDVQSTQSSAFSDEDVVTFGTLASQVAIVIQNARLIEEAQTALKSFTQSGRRAWLEREKDTVRGYTYALDGTLTPAQLQNPDHIQALLASGQTVILDSTLSGQPSSIAVPVKLRDQVIGVIRIESSEANRKWSDDEIAMVQSISERAAFALENARLFEETSKRAEQERTVSRVTSRISESNNFEHILRTTIQELGRTLGSSRTFIQLEPLSANGGGGLETGPESTSREQP